MPNLDERLVHADWTKTTMDILNFDGSPSEFKERVERLWSVEDFKRLPVYLHNQDHPLFSEL